MDARDPLAEARAVAGPDAWVLEPSPPAVADGPWFADDPPAAGTLDWHAWVAAQPGHAGWASERWLAAYRRLPPAVPPSYAETRLALHRLAVYVLSPARRRVNTKIALRWTLGGFGTPFFGEDEQVRVAGTRIVRERVGPSAGAAPITTLNEAAAFLLDGPPDLDWATGFDVPPAGDLDAALPVDPESAAHLAAWYGFATSVLEALRAELAADAPSRVQLWPEHFDIAFTAAATTFGASPGDAAVPEPYLYVLPPEGTPPGDAWNATTFTGAILPFASLAEAADQRAAGLDFFRSRAPAAP